MLHPGWVLNTIPSPSNWTRALFFFLDIKDAKVMANTN